MRRSTTLNPRVPGWWAAVILAGFLGFLGGYLGRLLPLWPEAPQTPIRMPAPWRIPRLPGMGGLRLAMVNDVIHERFAVRGPAWYVARNAASQAVIDAWAAGGGEPGPAVLDAFDDLAVGLDRIGDDAGAVAAMRRKAAAIGLEPPATRHPTVAEGRWEDQALRESATVADRGALSPADHHRYTTLANFGTALIHGHMRAALAGDAAAGDAVRAGLACLDAAVAINPAAHFGRETWQIVAVEHLLACCAKPELLLRYDLVGDALPGPQDPVDGTVYRRRPTVFMWPDGYASHAVPQDAVVRQRLMGSDRLFAPDWTADYVDAHIGISERIEFRSLMTRVGADAAWVAATGSTRREPAPFDEPLLGLLGMWTWGGGANPHSALAIATICERIGQRTLAVDAYERCLALAEGFHPDPAIRAGLVAHCRAREDAIARSLAPADPGGWLARERDRSTAELAWAQQRRQAARAAEEQALAAGTAPAAIPDGDGDPRPLASDPGSADEHWGVRRTFFHPGDGLVGALLAMAAAAWLGNAVTALARRSRTRR